MGYITPEFHQTPILTSQQACYRFPRPPIRSILIFDFRLRRRRLKALGLHDYGGRREFAELYKHALNTCRLIIQQK